MQGAVRRRGTRLRAFDYSSAGAYFVTVCTHRRELTLGEIEGETTRLSPAGEIVSACWLEITVHFPGVELDAFVVMPNHFHGIILIPGDSVGARHASPLRETGGVNQARVPLSTIIGSLKSASSRLINALRGTPGEPVWQRGFHDHIIRNEADLARIRDYILTNPLRWSLDKENPAAAQGV